MSLKKISLKSGKRAAFVKKTLAVVILAGFMWLIISAISDSVDSENLEPSVVKAPIMIKQRPASPGGMDIAHQDKKVFDLLDSETSQNDSGFVVAESKQSEKRVQVLSKQAMKKSDVNSAESIIRRKQKIGEKRIEKMMKEGRFEETKTMKVARPAVNVKKVVVNNTKKPVKIIAPVKVASAEKTVPVAQAASPKGWAVQLGSFRKTADAERAVKIYQKKVGNILQGLNPYIKKADLGAKGIVYRVYYIGLKDKAHATQICDQLKAQKQGCLRTKLR